MNRELTPREVELMAKLHNSIAYVLSLRSTIKQQLYLRDPSYDLMLAEKIFNKELVEISVMCDELKISLTWVNYAESVIVK